LPPSAAAVPDATIKARDNGAPAKKTPPPRFMTVAAWLWEPVGISQLLKLLEAQAVQQSVGNRRALFG